MHFERGFKHYFTKSEDGITYRLQIAIRTEQGEIAIAPGPDKWSSNQAKRFSKLCRTSNVPTAKERVMLQLESYFVKS